ncbi:hypothetical protein [Marinilactibacillus piezotolerans]|uniref:hypothetical protein n=1 Tax=Marinilactibacillus piezotolerans TaxID=258723 RepID=UPI0009B0377B|nr:hypothetical protein [Marinilactibacillus piezotolerans]
MKQSLKHFIRLVNFEFERMYKFLFAVMGILIAANLAGYILLPLEYMNNAREIMRIDSLTTAQFIENNDPFSMYPVSISLWVLGPIALGIIGFIFYSVFIWYREWFGKNTFIYRLLMIPVSRMQIFFAKFLMIVIGVFSLLALQLLSLWIGEIIVSNIVLGEFYTSYNLPQILQLNYIFQIIFPSIGEVFLGSYIIGFVAVLVLFTVILFERSFRIKGLVMGIGYAIACLFFVLSPNLIPTVFKNYHILFDSELILLIFGFSLIVGMISILLSRYLLKHKITV